MLRNCQDGQRPRRIAWTDQKDCGTCTAIESILVQGLSLNSAAGIVSNNSASIKYNSAFAGNSTKVSNVAHLGKNIQLPGLGSFMAEPSLIPQLP